MRLINTKTLALEEFMGDSTPSYASLSHTWSHGEEVSFQEWADLELASRKPGFRKIELARKQALDDGLGYLWVDTACINKDSSAELSEAINSMFTWYRQSVVCYAYLEDVDCDVHDIAFDSQLALSRWFTRGWTLQELLAPEAVILFSRRWGRLGDKNSLRYFISQITGIHPRNLTLNINEPPSIAQRMSWLSRRSTTRVEDMAYCMMGIFDINMPLLYGEGGKAFVRLQEEIIKTSDDHTIFCWHWDESVPADWVSMLAPAPRYFAASQDYAPQTSESMYNMSASPFAMTNVGLSIRLPLLEVVGSRRNTGMGLTVAVLKATRNDTSKGEPIGIPLWGNFKSGFFERTFFPPHPIPLLSGIYHFADEVIVRRKRYSSSHGMENQRRIALPTSMHAMQILSNHSPSMKPFSLQLYPFGLVDVLDGVLLLNTEVDHGYSQPHEPTLAPPFLQGALVSLKSRSSKELEIHLGAFFGVVTYGSYTGWICKVLDKYEMSQLGCRFSEPHPEVMYAAISRELEDEAERFKQSGELLPSSLYHFRHFAEGTLSVNISYKSFNSGNGGLVRVASIGFDPVDGRH